MFRPRHARLAIVLAVLTVSGVAMAGETKVHKPRGHAPEAVHVTQRRIPNEDYLNVGAVPDKGGDQRYFNDTKNPSYELGPTIFQRFQD